MYIWFKCTRKKAHLCACMHGRIKMYPPTYFVRECPERRALDLVSERWTGPVILTLSHGPLRYNALRRALPGVSQRMLTRAVRRLEEEGLVHRDVVQTVPPKVTYSLTQNGRSFKRVLEKVAAWGKEHF